MWQRLRAVTGPERWRSIRKVESWGPSDSEFVWSCTSLRVSLPQILKGFLATYRLERAILNLFFSISLTAMFLHVLSGQKYRFFAAEDHSPKRSRPCGPRSQPHPEPHHPEPLGQHLPRRGPTGAPADAAGHDGATGATTATGDVAPVRTRAGSCKMASVIRLRQ